MSRTPPRPRWPPSEPARALTSVLLEASPELIALIILAVATVMIVQPTVLAAIEVARSTRAAARGGGAVKLPPN